MTESISMEKMYKVLLALRNEVKFIKNRMVDMELVMTSNEEGALGEALDEHQNGKTKRYEDLKKELGD